MDRPGVREESLLERCVLGEGQGSSTADCPVQSGGPSAVERLKTLSFGLVLCKFGQVYCGPSATYWRTVRLLNQRDNKFLGGFWYNFWDLRRTVRGEKPDCPQAFLAGRHRLQALCWNWDLNGGPSAAKGRTVRESRKCPETAQLRMDLLKT